MWNMAAMMGQQAVMAQQSMFATSQDPAQMDAHTQMVQSAQMQLQQAQEQLQAAQAQMAQAQQQHHQMGGQTPQMDAQKRAGQQAPIGAAAAKRPRMHELFDAAAAQAGGEVSPQMSEVMSKIGEPVYRGEVRFEEPSSVAQALLLHGSECKGCTIGVEADVKSKDGTRVIVSNLGPQHSWQDLKDHFAMCGNVIYSGVRKAASTPCVGAALFENPLVAQQALSLSGTMLRGHQVEIKVHGGSKDGSKLKIYNLPPGLEWQELKDHFKQHGINPVFTETSANECPSTAEVRYEDPLHAQTACQMLNGSILAGAQIRIEMDGQVGNMTKLLVAGIPPGIEWQELKDHFNQVGHVAYCNVIKGESLKGPGKGKGKGKGVLDNNTGGKGMMNQQMMMGGCGMMGGCNTMMGGGGMGGGNRMLPNGLMISPNGVVVSMNQGM